MLQHKIGNFVWASGSGSGGKIGGSRKKFSERKRRAKGGMRLLRARGTAELREVASVSATLRNGKVGYQVSGINRSQFTGRTTVREVRRGGRRRRRASDRAKKREYRFRVRPR